MFVGSQNNGYAVRRTDESKLSVAGVMQLILIARTFLMRLTRQSINRWRQLVFCRVGVYGVYENEINEKCHIDSPRRAAYFVHGLTRPVE